MVNTEGYWWSIEVPCVSILRKGEQTVQALCHLPWAYHSDAAQDPGMCIQVTLPGD